MKRATRGNEGFMGDDLMRRLLCAGVGLALFSCGGGGGGGSTKQERDVSGNYALTYDDQLKLRLAVGGAVREVTANGYGGIVDFGSVNGQPVTLDLTQFCARPEVQCPSEAFWSKVAVTQPNLSANTLDLQQLTVVNDMVRDLDAGVRAASLSGLVDHNNADRFLLGLGLEGGANQACAAIGVSLAGGRFSRVGERTETTMELRTSKGKVCSLDGGVAEDAGVDDGGVDDAGVMDAGLLLPDGGVDCTLVPVKRLVIPPGAAVAGINDGRVFMGWLGGCAFGPVLVGATLTIETGFTGRRTGDYDPPPFTPAPVVLPEDGGIDAGMAEDGGVDAGP